MRRPGVTRPGPIASAVLVGALAVAVLALLLPRATERHALNSIDTAVKLIQAEELRRSSFRSMALSYPARDLDPREEFLPFLPPFVFLSRGQWQAIFSSFYAVIVAPLLPWGLSTLTGLSIVGVAVAAAATHLLPGSRWPAAWLALLATPIWLYAMHPTEVPLALGAAMAGMAVAARVRGAPGDWIAGLLLGVATLLRDEMLLLGPGLLYARTLVGASLSSQVRTVVAIGGPLLVMAAIDQWWFERPMLAHLRHAVPGLDLVLPRAQARLPHLPTMTWPERFETVGVFWLFGHSALAAIIGAAGLALAHAARWVGPWAVAAVVASAALIHAVDLVTLIQVPVVHGGLLRLSPFLLLALVPPAEGRPTPLVRLTWVATMSVLAAVMLTINTEGGKATGPRLIIGLWPLLAAGAVDTLAGYLRAARESRPARVTAVAGLVLAAGSVAMQLAVILPSRAARVEGDAEAARLVRAIGDRVIVNETMFEIQLTGGLYFERAVMLAQPHQRTALSRTLAAAGVRSFTFVLRPGAGHPGNFPDYREAESWTSGRFVISRWVLEASAAR